MKTIGITFSETRFDLYVQWMKEENVEVITLSYKQQNFDDIKKCDGIILTGGIDMHPKFYNNERLNYPLAPDKFNEERDAFEIKVFQFAYDNNIPVLAICRGMQLVNVALGGDMIQDIEEYGKENHRKNIDRDREHDIRIEQDSLLNEVTGLKSGKVNSAHHQALKRVSDELMVTAISSDGIIEAVEYKDKSNKAFFLAVQWHPERLMIEEGIAPFSKNIKKAFLQAIKD